MSENTSYDETGTPTALDDFRFADCVVDCNLYSDQDADSIHGQILNQSDSISNENYTYDADGRLTQTEQTPTAGQQLGDYSLPTWAAGPVDIVTGPDGNLWFTESWVGKIGEITPSGQITEYSTDASGSTPSGITVVSGPPLFGPFGLLVLDVVRARMRLEAGDGGSEAVFP
jgi:hypothetical protein